MSTKYISHFVNVYATNVKKNLKYSDTFSLRSFLSNCLLPTERHRYKFLHETDPYIFERKAAAHVETTTMDRVFQRRTAGRDAFGWSYDRPTVSRFSPAFLDPTANAELIHKF